MVSMWADVPDFEGVYSVSCFGEVCNTKTGRMLVQTETYDGYMRVRLCRNGVRKWYRVHRLVAAAFIPNPERLPTVNHIDEDKKNNHVYNLEWASMQYQVIYGTCLARIAAKRGQ